MRLKDLGDIINEGKLDISSLKLDGPAIILVTQDKVRISMLPDHGETKVITHQGKVKRVKWDEGEEF